MAHDVFGHVYEADQGLDDDDWDSKAGQPARETRAQEVERLYLEGVE